MLNAKALLLGGESGPIWYYVFEFKDFYEGDDVWRLYRLGRPVTPPYEPCMNVGDRPDAQLIAETYGIPSFKLSVEAYLPKGVRTFVNQAGNKVFEYLGDGTFNVYQKFYAGMDSYLWNNYHTIGYRGAEL